MCCETILHQVMQCLYLKLLICYNVVKLNNNTVNVFFYSTLVFYFRKLQDYEI